MTLLDKLVPIGLEVNSSNCEIAILKDDSEEATEAILEQCFRRSKLFRGVT